MRRYDVIRGGCYDTAADYIIGDMIKKRNTEDGVPSVCFAASSPEGGAS